MGHSPSKPFLPAVNVGKPHKQVNSATYINVPEGSDDVQAATASGEADQNVQYKHQVAAIMGKCEKEDKATQRDIQILEQGLKEIEMKKENFESVLGIMRELENNES